MDEGLFVYYNYSHFVVQVPPPRGEQEGGFILSSSLSASPWHEAVACACAP